MMNGSNNNMYFDPSQQGFGQQFNVNDYFATINQNNLPIQNEFAPPADPTRTFENKFPNFLEFALAQNNEIQNLEPQPQDLGSPSAIPYNDQKPKISKPNKQRANQADLKGQIPDMQDMEKVDLVYPNGRKRATKACLECQKRHTRCGFERPCTRCKRLGLKCVEVRNSKKRGRSSQKQNGQNPNGNPNDMDDDSEQSPSYTSSEGTSNNQTPQNGLTSPSQSVNPTGYSDPSTPSLPQSLVDVIQPTKANEMNPNVVEFFNFFNNNKKKVLNEVRMDSYEQAIQNMNEKKLASQTPVYSFMQQTPDPIQTPSNFTNIPTMNNMSMSNYNMNNMNNMNMNSNYQSPAQQIQQVQQQQTQNKPQQTFNQVISSAMKTKEMEDLLNVSICVNKGCEYNYNNTCDVGTAIKTKGDENSPKLVMNYSPSNEYVAKNDDKEKRVVVYNDFVENFGYVCRIPLDERKRQRETFGKKYSEDSPSDFSEFSTESGPECTSHPLSCKKCDPFSVDKNLKKEAAVELKSLKGMTADNQIKLVSSILQNAITKEEERKEFPFRPYFLLKELFHQPENFESVMKSLQDTEKALFAASAPREVSSDGFAVPAAIQFPQKTPLSELLNSESMGLMICTETFPQISYMSPGLIRALGYVPHGSQKDHHHTAIQQTVDDDEEEEESDSESESDDGEDSKMKTDLLPSSSDDSMSGMFKQIPKRDKKPSGPPNNLLDMVVRLKLFMMIQNLKEDQKARKMVISGIPYGQTILRNNFSTCVEFGTTLLMDRNSTINEVPTKIYKIFSIEDPSQLSIMFIFINNIPSRQ